MPSFVKEALIDISESTTVSLPIDLGYGAEFALYFPAAMTGTAMTFQVGDAFDGTYRALQDGSGAVSVTIAADIVVAPTGADREAFRGVRFIRLVSGTAEVGDRSIQVLISPREA
jgi:hypothetical protein